MTSPVNYFYVLPRTVTRQPFSRPFRSAVVISFEEVEYSLVCLSGTVEYNGLDVGLSRLLALSSAVGQLQFNGLDATLSRTILEKEIIFGTDNRTVLILKTFQ